MSGDLFLTCITSLDPGGGINNGYGNFEAGALGFAIPVGEYFVVQHVSNVGLAVPIVVKTWLLDNFQTANWLLAGATEEILMGRSQGRRGDQVTRKTEETKPAGTFAGGTTRLNIAFSLQLEGPTSASFAIDEIRIGTTLADAMSTQSVPEPFTGALAALSLIGLGARRRRSPVGGATA